VTRPGPPLIWGMSVVPAHMAPLVVTHWSAFWDAVNARDAAAGVPVSRLSEVSSR
jgi:hypothetical protein